MGDMVAMLFEVQEKLTDQEYKDLVDTLALVHKEAVLAKKVHEAQLRAGREMLTRMSKNSLRMMVGLVLRDERDNWDRLTPSVLRRMVQERFPDCVPSAEIMYADFRKLFNAEVESITQQSWKAVAEEERGEQYLFPIRR